MLRVLVVDDHSMFVEFLIGAIDCECDFVSVSHVIIGVGGVVMYVEFWLDVVLMDFQFLDIDGFVVMV